LSWCTAGRKGMLHLGKKTAAILKLKLHAPKRRTEETCELVPLKGRSRREGRVPIQTKASGAISSPRAVLTRNLRGNGYIKVGHAGRRVRGGGVKTVNAR